MIDKIVVVTKKTALEDLVQRLNSISQANFYLEQNGVSFTEYEQADLQYRRAIEALGRMLPGSIKHQFIDRDLLPTYQFGDQDLVVTLGPDGLVVNTAKYLASQPILALNPDPGRIDGILIPFALNEFPAQLERVLRGTARTVPVSMAQVTLNDSQTLYAVNDLFIGPRSHGSARYTLELGLQREQQSSSGIIVSTGAGSTGWLRSIVTGAWQVSQFFNRMSGAPPAIEQFQLGWDSKQLWFTVREPFVSKTAEAQLVFGQLSAGQELVITSHMPEHGVIFSDGIESDFLHFRSGAIARVGLADRQAHVIVR